MLLIQWHRRQFDSAPRHHIDITREFVFLRVPFQGPFPGRVSTGSARRCANRRGSSTIPCAFGLPRSHFTVAGTASPKVMDMTASAWRRSGLEPPPFERRTSPGPGGAHRARPRVRFYKKENLKIVAVCLRELRLQHRLHINLGREPINLPFGRLARVCCAPIATKLCSAAE